MVIERCVFESDSISKMTVTLTPPLGICRDKLVKTLLKKKSLHHQEITQDRDVSNLVTTTINCSYEETLFKSRPCGTRRIPINCDLLIHNHNHNGRPLYRQTFTTEAFLPFPDIPSAPFCARIRLPDSIPISRTCTIQLIIRDERGLVGKVFLLTLNLLDMPDNSQTIIRQQHYYDSQLSGNNKKKASLRHGLQVMVKNEKVSSFINSREISITNSMRILFSFEQQATLRPHNEFDELLRIETIFPLPGKYWKVKETNSLPGWSRECLSPKGEIL